MLRQVNPSHPAFPDEVQDLVLTDSLGDLVQCRLAPSGSE